MQDKRIKTFCEVAVLAALVFAASGLRIKIPLAVGNTAIHLGNVLCLMAGVLLGPVPGGLAAGIGSCVYDLVDPVYITSAPFTLVFKFLMGFLAGYIAHRKGREGRDLRWDLLGSLVGSLTYTALYVSKSFLTNVWFLQMPPEAAALAAAPKLAASLVNGLIAVVLAAPLALTVRAALRRMGWRRA